jgi:hypothetical protein
MPVNDVGSGEQFVDAVPVPLLLVGETPNSEAAAFAAQG